MSARSRSAAVVVLLAGVAAVAPGQPPKTGPDPAQHVVPASAAGFLSLNVAQVWDHKAFLPAREARGRVEFAWAVRSLVGLAPAEIDRVVVFWKDIDAPFVLLTARTPTDAQVVADALTRPGGKPPTKPADPRVLVAPGAEFPYLAAVNDRTFLLAPATADPKDVAAYLDQPRAGSGPVSGPITGAGKHTLMVALDVTKLADLPLPVGAPLLEAQTAVLTADLGEKQGQLELVLTFPDAAKAKAAAPVLRARLDELAGWLKAQEKKSYDRADPSGAVPGPLFEWAADILKGAKVTHAGTTLTATAEFDLEQGVSRLLTALPDAALSPRWLSPAVNNLKQIGLAIHAYHDANGHCPGNSYDKDGKPLLSWRVHVLPYIEQQALYQQFKLDEPWDSPNNLPLSKVVIRTYLVPGRPSEPGMTYLHSFIRPKGKDGNRPWLLEGESKGPSFAVVTDGLSNTMMVAEATNPGVWSQPNDLAYADGLPVPPLGGPTGQYAALFGDGSVRVFRRGQINDTNLRRIITVSDGNPVNIP